VNFVPTDLLHLLAAFAAAFIAGGINSVAGGGSMISFPVLLALGVPPLIANATNTVGIWPGAIGSLWGFRAEFAKIPRVYHWLLIPAIIGGIVGAFLLRFTAPSLFERIVPGLILFATIMFIFAPTIRKRLQKKPSVGAAASSAVIPNTGSQSKTVVPQNVFLSFALQFAVAIYGGYFGAGMGILMLSILSLIGMTDMLEMTAMTSFLSLAVNGVAGLVFAFSGLISWPIAGAMAIGAIMGGYFAAGVARKVGGIWIRRLVIVIGLTLAVVMLIRLL
jgi:uncharacterized protein